jgi:putative CocE/NonD family hydrolase
MRSPVRFLPVVLAVTLVAGCLAPSHPTTHPTPSASSFADPPTDGSAWPPGLAGPFKGLPLEHVSVTASDGVKLDGYLQRPAVPEGVKVPIVLQVGPYFGGSKDTSTDPPDPLVAAGFAFGKFAVRGTANSEGCLDFFGPREQRDSAELVDWAGNQTWGNGRVGMVGGSYDGTTVLQAAVQAPLALKAAIAIAPVPDVFTTMATPQGAVWNGLAAQVLAGYTGIGAEPRAQGDDQNAHLQGVIDKVTTRPRDGLVYCPDSVTALTQLSLEPAINGRDATYWKARDLGPRLANVRAALLYTDGYYDDQYFEGAHVWSEVTHAPFEYRAGPWPHALPDVPNGTWMAMELQWFDYWLKGVGDRPADLGHAVWEDTVEPGIYPNHGKGSWHTSDAWPPPEAKVQAFNLSGTSLSRTVAGTERTYHSAPIVEGTSAPIIGTGGWQWPKNFLCDDAAPVSDQVEAIYATDVTETPWLLAGIPHLDLNLTSDQPGGIVNAFLLDEQTNACSPAGETAGGAGPALISFGAADLEHLHDLFGSQAFPTNTPTPVHLELTDIAQVVQPGHRLVLVVGAGNPVDHSSKFQPTVTIHAAPDTQLLLPVVG